MKLLPLLLFVLLLQSCINPASPGKKSELTFNDSQATSNGNNNSGSGGNSDSVSAFGATVHQITSQRCVGCHGNLINPYHASPDVQTAHDSIVDTKINWDNVSNSRMVAKLRDENHNCWGVCADNATEMENAINQWKSMRGDTGSSTTPMSGFMTTDSNVLQSYLDMGGDNGTIVLPVESATLQAPMVLAGDYIWVPENGQGVLGANANNAGLAFINFALSMSGNYKIYGLVDAPTGSDNSFHIKVDNGANNEWHILETSGFEWREVSNTSNRNEVTTFISAGNHTLEIRQREDGTKIKTVVISNDPGINLNDVSASAIGTLSYNLSSLIGGIPATLEIDFTEYDMYSYKFSNPRIISNTPLTVKNLRIHINGIYNAQFSTYELVDMTTSPGTTILSDRSMIAFKDKGPMLDVVSFSFEVLNP